MRLRTLTLGYFVAVVFLPAVLTNASLAVGADGCDPGSELFSSSSCTNISGTWTGSEYGTLCCSVLGMTECEQIGGSGLVNFFQNGCSVGYNFCLDGYGCLDRTGTITGNTLQFTGAFPIPLDEDIVITQNTVNGSGSVFGSSMQVTGSGSVSGLYYYQGNPYSFWCTGQSQGNFNRLTPGAALLMQPSWTIETNLPVYGWHAVSNASWYFLWVNDSSGNAIKRWYSASAVQCAGGVGVCSALPDIPVGGDVVWWIQTWNSYGYGPWSDGMAFTAPSLAPGKATPISPSGAVDTNTPTYSWDAVERATWYLLKVNPSEGNPIIWWYAASSAGCPSGSGTCSATPDLPVGGASEWWVQTWNTHGYGPWSDAMSFTSPKLPLPGKVILISPSGEITTGLPTYTWNADAYSTWYLLWVDDGSGTPVVDWYTALEAGCADGIGTCSATPNVLVGGPSEWRVLTWNSLGRGPWSEGMTFVAPEPTLPGQATLMSPSGKITTDAPSYTWNAVANATWYYLWVNDSSGNRIRSWHPASEVGCAGGTGTCSVAPERGLVPGPCEWWILTWNSLGFGPWSDGLKFILELP
jgi:hypothetical protein